MNRPRITRAGLGTGAGPALSNIRVSVSRRMVWAWVSWTASPGSAPNSGDGSNAWTATDLYRSSATGPATSRNSKTRGDAPVTADMPWLTAVPTHPDAIARTASNPRGSACFMCVPFPLEQRPPDSTIHRPAPAVQAKRAAQI